YQSAVPSERSLRSFCTRASPPALRTGLTTGSTIPSAAPSHCWRDFAAILQLVLTVDHYRLAWVQAPAQANVAAGGLRNRDHANLDAVVGAHGVDIRSLRAALNGRSGNNSQVMLGVDQQMHVHKLIGKKRVVRIVETGFQLVGAGCGIDLIIDGEQLSRGNFLRVVAIISVDIELDAGAELGAHLGKLVLRQTEEHGNGLKLSNDDQAVRVVGVHDISRIYEAQADAPADRRSDAGICELKLRIGNRAFVGMDGTVILADKRGLRIELLLRDDAFF